HLPTQVRLTNAAVPPMPDQPDAKSKDLDDRLEEIEKGLIVAALIRCQGVQARAAGMLGIKERSLWHRVKKYGLDPSAYKQG
ncbi:MAG: helix-turn-helix domain-containing protein, partial [Acidobacteriota bacterium]